MPRWSKRFCLRLSTGKDSGRNRMRLLFILLGFLTVVALVTGWPSSQKAKAPSSHALHNVSAIPSLPDKGVVRPEATISVNSLSDVANGTDGLCTCAKPSPWPIAMRPRVSLRESTFVLAEYFGYLRRNPNDAPESTLDYTGYDFWLTKLNQFNGNYINAEMVKAFLSSIEYRQRFGP
jgi:hypothetical protein